jgi:hypothetical protein
MQTLGQVGQTMPKIREIGTLKQIQRKQLPLVLLKMIPVKLGRQQQSRQSDL